MIQECYNHSHVYKKKTCMLHISKQGKMHENLELSAKFREKNQLTAYILTVSVIIWQDRQSHKTDRDECGVCVVYCAVYQWMYSGLCCNVIRNPCIHTRASRTSFRPKAAVLTSRLRSNKWSRLPNVEVLWFVFLHLSRYRSEPSDYNIQGFCRFTQIKYKTF